MKFDFKSLLVVGAIGAGAYFLLNKPASSEDGAGSSFGSGATDPLSQLLASNPLGDFFKSDPATKTKSLADVFGGLGAQPLNEGGGLPLGTKSAIVDSPASLLQMQAELVNGSMQKDILQTKSNARGDVTVSVRDDIAASWGAAASNKFITNTVGAGNPAIYGAGRTNLDGSITSFNIPFNSTGAKKDSSPQSTYYAPVSAKLPTVNSLSTQYSSLQKTASNFSPVSSGGWQSKLPTPAGNTTTVKKYMTPLPTSSGGGGFR
jgi:hypothetical protein